MSTTPSFTIFRTRDLIDPNKVNDNFYFVGGESGSICTILPRKGINMIPTTTGCNIGSTSYWWLETHCDRIHADKFLDMRQYIQTYYINTTTAQTTTINFSELNSDDDNIYKISFVGCVSTSGTNARLVMSVNHDTNSANYVTISHGTEVATGGFNCYYIQDITTTCSIEISLRKGADLKTYFSAISLYKSGYVLLSSGSFGIRNLIGTYSSTDTITSIQFYNTSGDNFAKFTYVRIEASR